MRLKQFIDRYNRPKISEFELIKRKDWIDEAERDFELEKV
jgi:hypothetical protein